MKNLILIILVAFAAVLACNDFGVPGLFLPMNNGSGTDSIPNDSIPNDSIPIPDTCHNLLPLPDTAFTILIAHSENGFVGGWFYGDYDTHVTPFHLVDSLPLLLDSIMPNFKYTYYEQDGNISVLVDGTDNPNVQWFKFRSYKMGVSGGTGLNALVDAFTPRGSMTYDEALNEVNKRKNIKQYDFYNCKYTPSQFLNLVYGISRFYECKLGGSLADNHTYNPSFPLNIPQSVQDSQVLYQWKRVKP